MLYQFYQSLNSSQVFALVQPKLTAKVVTLSKASTSSPCKKKCSGKNLQTKLGKVSVRQNMCSDNYKEEPRQVSEEQIILRHCQND